MNRLTIIVATTTTNGIGKVGGMPWHIHADLKYFKEVTSKAPDGHQNVVIMGRKTWESIPAKNKPLPNRFNIVISNDPSYKLNVAPGTGLLVGSLDDALKAKPSTPIHRYFIIGGASLYNRTLGLTSVAEVDRVLVTRITAPEYDCDTFMPEFRNTGKWKQESQDALAQWVGIDVPAGKQKQGDIEYEFQMWTRED